MDEGVGRQVGHVGVAGQGVELSARDLEDAPAPQMTCDLEVVSPGEPLDLLCVAVDDNLYQVVGARFEPIGQCFRDLPALARTGVYTRRERQRQREAERQGRRNGASAWPPLRPLAHPACAAT